MYIWKSTVFLIALIWATSSVHAGEPGKSDALSSKSEAIEYFRIGVSCFDDKDFNGALVSFQKAYDLNPSWKLHYNIGHCQAALKLYGMAVITFERYLAEGGDAVPESRRDEILAELDRMRKMVGDIQVIAPDGLDVYVDDIHRGTTPLPGPISVSAGLLHHVRLADGDETLLNVEKSVRGETSSEVIYSPHETISEPEPVSPPVAETKVLPRPQSEHSDSVRKKISPVPFVVATTTTVLLGGATVTLAILVNRGKDNMKSESDGTTLNKMRKTGMGTLFGTVGAGLAATILAGFTDFKGDRSAPVAFYATPSEGGVVISGSF